MFLRRWIISKPFPVLLWFWGMSPRNCHAGCVEMLHLTLLRVTLRGSDWRSLRVGCNLSSALDFPPLHLTARSGVFSYLLPAFGEAGPHGVTPSAPGGADCVLEPCCGDVPCPGRFSYLFLVPSTGWKCGSGVEGGPGWGSRSFLDSPFVSHSALQTHCDVVPPPSIKCVFMF